MTEHKDQEALRKKLDEAEPGRPITLTQPELYVLRGWARTLIGGAMVFGSAQNMAKWIAIFASGVAGVLFFLNLVMKWLATGSPL